MAGPCDRRFRRQSCNPRFHLSSAEWPPFPCPLPTNRGCASARTDNACDPDHRLCNHLPAFHRHAVLDRADLASDHPGVAAGLVVAAVAAAAAVVDPGIVAGLVAAAAAAVDPGIAAVLAAAAVDCADRTRPG